MFPSMLWILLSPCILFVGQVIYNIFIHPLRSYPGPWYTKASRWPWYYQRVHGTQMYWIAQLHERYGSIVRTAPDHLSYIEPEAWKDIYAQKSSGRGNLPKDTRYYGNAVVGGASIVNADDETHSRIRRSISPAFSDKALIAQEPLLRQYVNLMVTRLREAANSGDEFVDIVRMFNFVTFDFAADLIFGEPLGLLEHGEYVPWVASIITHFKAIGIIWSIQSAFSFLMPLITKTVLRSMTAKRKQHGAFAVERVDRRLARQTDRPDIWTFVLSNTESGKGLSRGEMHSNGSIIMAAGTETTASLLSGITWLLCNHHDVLDKLNREVRGAFDGAGDDGPSMQALARLPYLNACLQEALRIYPPAPLGMPRMAPLEGAIICGRPVAAKTTVYVTSYAAHHSKRNFCEPEAFHPERWLPDPDPCFANDKLNACQAFSLGPRNCVGKNLAWHEMRSLLTAVLLNFDIELAEQATKNWLEQKAYAAWDKPPLYIRLNPRDSKAST